MYNMYQRKQNKRQAFTRACTASTRAITKPNATACQLLMLPNEIKQMIWRELFGNRQIHLIYRSIKSNKAEFKTNHGTRFDPWDGKGRWLHTICVADQSDEEAQRRSKIVHQDEKDVEEVPGTPGAFICKDWHVHRSEAHHICQENMCPATCTVQEFYKFPKLSEDDRMPHRPELKM
ncbi:hypothetical protein MMC11_002112 [Xylographa trunciseda]|nr:hypothetical protein [Xylographa trunciseda]